MTGVDGLEMDMAPEAWQVEVFALVSAADALRIAVIAMGLDASTAGACRHRIPFPALSG